MSRYLARIPRSHEFVRLVCPSYCVTANRIGTSGTDLSSCADFLRFCVCVRLECVTAVVSVVLSSQAMRFVAKWSEIRVTKDSPLHQKKLLAGRCVCLSSPSYCMLCVRNSSSPLKCAVGQPSSLSCEIVSKSSVTVISLRLFEQKSGMDSKLKVGLSFMTIWRLFLTEISGVQAPGAGPQMESSALVHIDQYATPTLCRFLVAPGGLGGPWMSGEIQRAVGAWSVELWSHRLGRQDPAVARNSGRSKSVDIAGTHLWEVACVGNIKPWRPAQLDNDSGRVQTRERAWSVQRCGLVLASMSTSVRLVSQAWDRSAHRVRIRKLGSAGVLSCSHSCWHQVETRRSASSLVMLESCLVARTCASCKHPVPRPVHNWYLVMLVSVLRGPRTNKVFTLAVPRNPG